MDITLHGIELSLLSQRAVFWPSESTLLIADPHFGKEATFRTAGIPVPIGSTQATLSQIESLLQQYQPTRLVILGDMFHHRTSLSKDVCQSLDAFFAGHPDTQHTLVLGNHDAGLETLPSRWNMQVVERMTLGNVALAHDPATWPDDNIDLLLCGHLHPSFRVASMTDAAGKLPCFWYSRHRLVLPAIGHFTGTHRIKPLKNDRVWIVADDMVFEHSLKNTATT